MITLPIEERKVLGKTGKRLPSDKMAAVFYGHKEKSTPILVSKAAFKKVFKKAGESTVVVLEGAGKKIEALIHEVDFDPIKGEPRHADFYALEKGKKVRVDVPVHFGGESEAVKAGGILVKVMHEIKVEAEPKDLPHAINVDISLLVNNESRIAIKDIKFPSGVRVVDGPEEIVAAITIAKEEKIEEPVDLSTIEVEKKGKKEEEGVPVTPEKAGKDEKAVKPEKGEKKQEKK